MPCKHALTHEENSYRSYYFTLYVRGEQSRCCSSLIIPLCWSRSEGIFGVSDRLLLQTKNLNSDLVLQNPHTFSPAVPPKLTKIRVKIPVHVSWSNFKMDSEWQSVNIKTTQKYTSPNWPWLTEMKMTIYNQDKNTTRKNIFHGIPVWIFWHF